MSPQEPTFSPTPSALVEEGTALLAAAGVQTPRLDAELLLRHVLGWSRADLIARGSEPVSPAAAELFRNAIGERARRRPLQHLTGVQAFWRYDFRVTPDVLIPRPETEVLVEAALELVRDAPTPVVVDVGTGSGCIALSIAAERPDAQVHAIDLSASALHVARGNAARLGLADRVRFHQGDLLAPVRALAGAVDLVVSNPPYVTAAECARLAPEVRDHEPYVALVAPEPGHGLYARLAAETSTLLRGGGHLLAEVGAGMEEDVSRILREAGLSPLPARHDLAGIARVVGGRRRV